MVAKAKRRDTDGGKKAAKYMRIRDLRNARMQALEQKALRRGRRWNKNERKEANNECATFEKYARIILGILKMERVRTGRRCVNGLGRLSQIAGNMAEELIRSAR